MFEKDLYDHLAAQFPDLNIGFGEVPEGTKTPYAVFYALDPRAKRTTVCDKKEGFTSGESFIQINIFSLKYSSGYAQRINVEMYLNGLRHFEANGNSYDVWSADETGSLSLSADNGLSANVLAKTYNYEVK